jgi:hypothetical protein
MDMSELSKDVRVIIHLLEQDMDIHRWVFGIQLQRLRPDIAQRFMDAQNEMNQLDPRMQEAAIHVIGVQDNLMQAVIDMFEAAEKPPKSA